MRSTYVWRNGQIYEKGTEPVQEEHGTAPYVISDTMPELRHMATGRMISSKAAFRAETRAAGCVEVGNDPAATRPRKPVPLSRERRREDIKRTIYELRNGRS